MTYVPFKVGSLGPHTILPIAISCPIVFSWISSMVWNLFPFKGDFSFGKSQTSQGAKNGLWEGLSHLSDLMFHQKTAWDVIHEQTCCCDEAVSSAADVKNVNLMQIHRSTCSVILNVTATQYTCSLSGFYHPHWLVQWSHHCSCMGIPAHSPWLPGYIDVAQTILIMLTMAGLFPDTPHKNVQNNPK